MNDKEKVAEFYYSTGEKSARFFNVNHGNEKRTFNKNNVDKAKIYVTI